MLVASIDQKPHANDLYFLPLYVSVIAKHGRQQSFVKEEHQFIITMSDLIE